MRHSHQNRSRRIVNSTMIKEMLMCFKGKSSDPAYENRSRARRKSAPTTSTHVTVMDTEGSPSKFGFLPKRMKTALKRTKSATKIDRKATPIKNIKEEENSEEDMPFLTQKLKTSRSHESVLSGSTGMEATDMTLDDVQVKPLHSSVLGQDHCFQLVSTMGTKYYSCRSATEREKWVQSLRNTMQPDRDEKSRIDNTLTISIIEAKGIPAKKKYFCELCLDENLYARTSSKVKGEMLFWGEQFSFMSLPNVATLSVHLYKDSEKKKKKDKNGYVGSVQIPLSAISTRQGVEKWYPLNSTLARTGSKSDGPSLRIKARFQKTLIQPLDQYSDLLEYLKKNAVTLCETMEPLLNVKTKEELCVQLMKIFQHEDIAQEFLAKVVSDEIEKLANDSLIFRANSIATKAMEAYLKLVGDKYLKDTLGDYISTLYENDEDCEVDPSKVSSNNMQNHQSMLTVLCEMVWCKIINSFSIFPSDIKAVFHSFRNLCSEKDKEEIADHLISASIFLRFLCPAIMSPSLFDLIQEYPTEKTARTLTLIAKTVQNLANFTKFGTKEEYMVFMNDFVEREWSSMKTFLHEISGPSDEGNVVKFDRYIDLGRELAILQSLLTETMDLCNKDALEKLESLPEILERIRNSTEQPLDSSELFAKKMAMYSSTPALSSNIPDHLVKLFQDADLSNSGDVAMLPAFDHAMVGGAKSVAVNTLVQFLKHEEQRETNEAQDTKNRESFYLESQSPEEAGPLRRVNLSYDLFLEQSSGEVSEAQSGASSPSPPQERAASPPTPPPRNRENAAHILAARSQALPLSFSNPVYQLSVGSLKYIDETTNDSKSSIASGRSTRGFESYTVGQPLPMDPKTFFTLGSGSSSTETTPSPDKLPGYGIPMMMDAPHTLPKLGTKGGHVIEQSLQGLEEYGQSTMAVGSGGYARSQGPPRPVSLLTESPRTRSHHYHGHQTIRTVNTAVKHSLFTTMAPPLHAAVLSDSSSGDSPSSSTAMQFSPTSSSNTTTPYSPMGFGDPPAPPPLSSDAKKPNLQEISTQTTLDSSVFVEYEKEMTALKEQLELVSVQLVEAQSRLAEQETKSQREVLEMKAKLKEGEEQLHRQHEEKDKQIKDIITRLMCVEDELKREQKTMQAVVESKQKIIDAQEKQIQTLDSANSKLMAALSQLKERYHLQARNGAAGSPRPSQKFPLNGDFKSSHC
ncbi:ras GTPase-activating protein nGAP-like isoform X4 [Ptychodera flava]|uniref:ras GTPase-activating protein nGAP-like isoform X4 n=1 Tax=Ptychodera flava TaxID=63121 RepID=UPI00396AB167